MGIAPAVDSAPKERRIGSGSFALIAGVGAVLAVGVITIALTTHGTAPPPGGLTGVTVGQPVDTSAPLPEVTHAVRYELSGDAALNITYVTQGSAIAQVSSAKAPWSVSLEWRAPVNSSPYYSLSAQETGRGSLTCRIVVDGAVVSERTVSVPNGVVHCSQTVG